MTVSKIAMTGKRGIPLLLYDSSERRRGEFLREKREKQGAFFAEKWYNRGKMESRGKSVK